MRGAILGMAILAASAGLLARADLARAGDGVDRPWRSAPRHIAPPQPPRPVAPPPVVTPPVVTPARISPPLSTKTVKPPNYTKRTMALIQQNIALQAAMRSTNARSADPGCQSTWSQAKLRRKGCLPAPAEALPPPRPSSIAMTDARLCVSAVEGFDCGAVRAARDRAAEGR